jgi:tetratricopeptide (TPR) repeat protein
MLLKLLGRLLGGRRTPNPLPEPSPAPTPAGAARTLARQTADRLIAEGNCAEEAGTVEEACERYSEAVRAAPDYAKAHLNLGIGLESAGAAGAAISAYEAALAIDSSDPFAAYNLGKLLYTGGRVEEAERLLRQALQNRPAFPEAQVVMSRVLEAQGNLGAAAAALDAALRLQPDEIGTLIHYAGVLGRLDRMEDALAALRHAVAIDPGNADANYRLASLLLGRGARDEAIAILESESTLRPDRLEVWDCLGRAYCLTSRHVEAERAYRNAVRLRPDLFEAHYNLAVCLANQDKLRDSIDHFRNARRIRPHDPELRKKLYSVLVTILQDSGDSGHVPAPRFPRLDDQPLVTVIVPTQNRPRMLRDALHSVSQQRYRNWEAIVVNDGGEDISPILKSMPSEPVAKIRQISLPAVRGAAAARNTAIKVAKGEVLAFLDDDDRYMPDHLERLVSGLRASNAGIAFSAAELVEETIHDGTRVDLGRKPLFPGIRYSPPLLLVGNFIPIITWGVRRECVGLVGLFDEALQFLEDWDYLLRLSFHVDFHQINDVTAEYRVRKQASDRVTTRHSHRDGVKSLYRRHAARGLELVELARELYLETLT